MEDSKRCKMQRLAAVFFLVSVAQSRSEIQPSNDDTKLLHLQEAGRMFRRSALGPDPRLFAPDQKMQPKDRAKRATVTHTGTSQTDINQFVDTHNAKRRAVSPVASNMKLMSWDASAAAVAQAHADKCVFSHNSDRGNLGENIYAASGTYDSASTAVNAVTNWYNEVSDYTYADNSCSKVCGHYTQVVWATSSGLGCGIATCQPLDLDDGTTWPTGTIVVCNYSPPGNYRGQKPYLTGTACADCGSGFQCDNGLCKETSTCTLQCLNGGTLNQAACTCDCTGTGYTGNTCQTDDSGVSGTVPSLIVIFVTSLGACII
ncbi:hypothetical protein BaRGS_00003517 [Batillaria attramentaria]|uniref:SCP domain-containing protein n=1 Tax=Batillaria attramentaria TaxID=370345 RepID=A0ABD0M0C7_9CAEN